MSKRRPWSGTSSETLEMLGAQIAENRKILEALLRGDVLSLYYKKGTMMPFRLRKQGYTLPVENAAEDSVDPQRVT